MKTEDDGHVLLEVVADLVGGNRHSRHSIASKTGRSLATADRWVSQIRKAFPSIRKTKEGKTTWWQLPESRRDAPTKRATAGVCVAASLASIFDGSQHERNLKDARDYLVKASGTVVGDLDRKFFFAPKGGETALPERAGDLDAVIDGLFNETYVSFRYAHRDGRTESLEVRPLTLVIFDHQFYLVALRDSGERYGFRFSRMTDVEAEDRKFSYPPKGEYDPATVFAPLFGIHLSSSEGAVEDVHVALHGEWAAFAMTHRWHPSQQVVPQGDGSVVVQLRVVLCPEVQTWVLGFGEAAMVIRPHRLRERIASRVRRSADAYGKTPSLAKAGARRTAETKRATSRTRRG